MYANWALAKSAYNPTEVLLIRLALESAGIRYMTKNELVQNLFALGALGFVNPVTGPVEFWVPVKELEQAQAAFHPQRPFLPEQLPEECPACMAKTIPGKNLCPDCGLNLA
jgi:hypothetical protein